MLFHMKLVFLSYTFEFGVDILIVLPLCRPHAASAPPHPVWMPKDYVGKDYLFRKSSGHRLSGNYLEPSESLGYFHLELFYQSAAEMLTT